MDKTIIFTVIITAMVMIGLFVGYNYYTNSPKIIDSPTPVVNQQTEEEIRNSYVPVENYPLSKSLEERTAKIKEIQKQVELKYPNEDINTKQIIVLCLSGNNGACDLVKSKNIILLK